MERAKESITGQTEEACCQCPFCDNAMEMPFPFCQACGAEINRCPVCGKVLPKDADVCEHCAEV